MSFMKQPKRILYIGLFVIVIGAVSLLVAYALQKPMSDRKIPMQALPAASSAAMPVSPVSQAATTTVLDGITYEVVTSQAAQEQGLGGRPVIPDNYAMLFVFPKDGTYGFWMKDMLTSIDMIWLTDNGTIAAVNDSVSPSTYPGVFYPPYPIRYVLETRAGFAREKSWHVGTQVPLPASVL
jgi:uncharacterized membrane protein (UPF0127 family)